MSALNPPAPVAAESVPAPPPAPPAPLSRYQRPLADVVRFLTAVGRTATPTAGADITDSFRETFATVSLPADAQALHAYIAQLNTIPGEHLSAVLGAVSAATRQHFHKVVLELSEGMKAAMPELGEAVSVLRLLIIRLLPAINHMEESKTLETLSAVADNYALSDRVAQLIRPDEGNPKLQMVAKEAVEVGNAYKSLKQNFDSFVSRMQTMGFDTDDVAKDEEVIKAYERKDRSKVIILSVLLGLVFLAVIILAAILMKRRPGTAPVVSTSAPALGGVSAAPHSFANTLPDFSVRHVPYPYDM
jgi:flagellar basal body-associated protein FliL